MSARRKTSGPDWDIIPPPASATVFHDHRPVLYGADGKAFVRAAGFTVGGQMAQTTGTLPQLAGNTIYRKPAKKKGKK